MTCESTDRHAPHYGPGAGIPAGLPWFGLVVFCHSSPLYGSGLALFKTHQGAAKYMPLTALAVLNGIKPHVFMAVASVASTTELVGDTNK